MTLTTHREESFLAAQRAIILAPALPAALKQAQAVRK
jgi:hypothetical protein